MKRRIFGAILLLILALSVIIGSTYAFFNINKTYGQNTVTATAKTMSVDYADGPVINVSGILPGASVIKTFTVENTGSNPLTYNINLQNVINEFTNKNDMTYTITSNNGGGYVSNIVYPSNDTVLLGNITIPAHTIQSYTININYANASVDQSIDMNKTITGTLNIS